LASGKDEVLSEYPAVKQISLGPKMSLKDIGVEVNNEILNIKKMSKLLELGVKNYKRIYEKYKSVAEEYNIDLFFCDMMLNDACIDIAHTLKKPVVGFTSGLRSNNQLTTFRYCYFFFLKKKKNNNKSIKNILFYTYFSDGS
jgi:hypothetical protein